MKLLLACSVVAVSVLGSLHHPAYARMTQVVEVESFLSPGNAAQMQYSPDRGLLFLRNAGSVLRVVNTATHLQTSWEVPNVTFTDMDLTPDGQYLYAADFGGEITGSGTPSAPSHVHRYNLATGNWDSRVVPGVAYRIEAVDDERFLLLSSDQLVTLALQRWGTSVTTLSKGTWTLYSGDIQYDPATGRVIHGQSGSSSNEIKAFEIVSDSLIVREDTGTYGSAQSGGGTYVLATDASVFYYGKLQVDATDVRINRNFFPTAIYAASADIAFGQNGYYDALTGAALGNLGFSTTTYALNSNGTELWAFDPATDYLHHYLIVPEPLTGMMVCLGTALQLMRRKDRQRLS